MKRMFLIFLLNMGMGTERDFSEKVLRYGPTLETI